MGSFFQRAGRRQGSGTKPGRCAARLTFLALAACLLTRPAAAHDRSISYSAWRIEGRTAQVTVRLSRLDLSRFPWSVAVGPELERLIASYLTKHLHLLAGNAVCGVTNGPRPLAAPPGRVVYEWRLACPEADPLSIRSSLFLDVAPSHLHFARVVWSEAPTLERVLARAEPGWALTVTTPAAPARELQGTSLLGYIGIGLEHILGGYDHLAFLLALLLLASSLPEVAKVVTGFTMAHSITLALAVLGYVRPQSAPIEALIGLSIALVAAENVWLVSGRSAGFTWLVAATLALLALAAACGYGGVPPLTLAGLALFSICYFTLLRRAARPAPLRFAIAFLFGLVHGFAFAGVLVEAGLPASRLTQALFGFNVGVELGQLGVVALVWPLLVLAGGGLSPFEREAVPLHLELGSAAVCGLGAFWFVTRAFG